MAPGPNRIRWLALALALAVPLQPAAATLEYAVKASYLSKFVSFIDWPPAAFASPASTFNLCVVGDDPFGAALDQAVAGRRVDGHLATVRRLKRIDPGSGCHVVFLGASKAQSIPEALKSIQGEPVLTVADRAPGAAGVIIQFVVTDNRVRFDIDPAAANANRIAISSKLLSLAVSTKAGA